MKHSSKAAPLNRPDLLMDVPIRKVKTQHIGSGSRRMTTTHESRGVSVHSIYERRRGAPLRTRPERPPADLLRYAIEAEYCYWCGKRGFKSLVGHTAKIHDVDRFTIRDWSGMMMHEPVSPELSEQARERAIRNGLAERVRTAPPARRKRRVTEAGKETMRKKLDAVRGHEQALAASHARADRIFVVRNCTECGTPITTPRYKRTERRFAKLTCSEACRKLIRQRTQLVGATTRRRRKAEAHASVD